MVLQLRLFFMFLCVYRDFILFSDSRKEKWTFSSFLYDSTYVINLSSCISLIWMFCGFYQTWGEEEDANNLKKFMHCVNAEV